VLVEGAGGVTVNLGQACGLLDIAGQVSQAGQPVTWIVVARAGLGTLNHATLTVQAIQHRGFTVHGIVIGSWPAEPGPAELYNRHDLASYARRTRPGRHPRRRPRPPAVRLPGPRAQLDPDRWPMRKTP
jgi:dethiobiotin synthetase